MKKLSILILDDDETMLHYLQKMVRKIADKNSIDIEITAANDADKAWQAIQHEDIDGAIVDVFLHSGASGIQFADAWDIDNKKERIAIHTGLSDPGNMSVLRASYSNVIAKGSNSFYLEISCWLSGLCDLKEKSCVT